MSFQETILPHVDKPVLRLGCAGNYGMTSDDVLWAADRGVRYWVWGFSYGRTTEGLKALLARDRDAHVLTLLGFGVFGWQVRQSVESTLRMFKTDYLDVFKLGWLGVTSRMSAGITDTLLQLKHEGKLRAIGTSIHDRQRAAQLARDSAIDLFMLRYNAKHPGAEKDIFPHLALRGPAVVAYTALAWRQLIKPMDDLDIPAESMADAAAKPRPLTADLCYRFALSSPHVNVVLTGPRNRDELAANLRSLERGPLTDEEMRWVRRYGQAVHKARKLDYLA